MAVNQSFDIRLHGSRFMPEPVTLAVSGSICSQTPDAPPCDHASTLVETVSSPCVVRGVTACKSVIDPETGRNQVVVRRLVSCPMCGVTTEAPSPTSSSGRAQWLLVACAVVVLVVVGCLSVYHVADLLDVK